MNKRAHEPLYVGDGTTSEERGVDWPEQLDRVHLVDPRGYIADEGLSVAAIERKLDLPPLWVKRSRARDDSHSFDFDVTEILNTPAHQNRLGRREQCRRPGGDAFAEASIDLGARSLRQ